MARRDWIKITEYDELKNPVQLENGGVFVAILTVQIAPLGIEMQCIRQVRFPEGDLFLLPSYRTQALSDYAAEKQSYFRIKGKHKSQRFQLQIEEAVLRDLHPGPLKLSKACIPKIPEKVRRAALRPNYRQFSSDETAHFLRQKAKDLS